MGNCFRKAGDHDKIIERVHRTIPPPLQDAERSKGRMIKLAVGAVEKKEIIREELGSVSIGESSNSNSNSNSNSKMKMKMAMPPKMFTLDELKSATRNFRPDTVVGEGGFGRVFKGWVDEKTLRPSKVGVGIPVAVKKSNPDSQQGLQEWQSEVKFLGKFSHPNLVKLLGYCWEENQFLLVYEYMQKGSLETHLFRKGPEALHWDIRLKVAIGAAKGLAFLHTSEKTVIYRDFKSSNILLDGDYNAKLSDFGLAKLGPPNGKSHVTTRVLGTYGYAAPEYMATGHLYVKSDVYGFGVVLLELLTGLIALDTTRPSGEQSLLEWTKSSLSDKRKLKKIMDPRITQQYSIIAAFQIAQLILKCLQDDPKNRPSMEEVLETLEKAQSIKPKPKVKKPNAVHQSRNNRSEENSTHNQRPSPSPSNNHYNGHSKSRIHSPRYVAQNLPRPMHK